MVGQVTVEYDDRAFQAALERELARLVVTTERKVFALALKVQRNARLACPVDTGRLRASISVTEGRDGRGYFVDIGTNVDYAAFVEYGTSVSAAQPFLRPGLLQALRQGV